MTTEDANIIHVHHHDIEHHATSFNEGYEAAMAQYLADDPTTANDWLEEKLREAKEQAWDEGRESGAAEYWDDYTPPNPYIEEQP